MLKYCTYTFIYIYKCVYCICKYIGDVQMYKSYTMWKLSVTCLSVNARGHLWDLMIICTLLSRVMYNTNWKYILIITPYSRICYQRKEGSSISLSCTCFLRDCTFQLPRLYTVQQLIDVFRGGWSLTLLQGLQRVCHAERRSQSLSFSPKADPHQTIPFSLSETGW